MRNYYKCHFRTGHPETNDLLKARSTREIKSHPSYQNCLQLLQSYCTGILLSNKLLFFVKASLLEKGGGTFLDKDTYSNDGYSEQVCQYCSARLVTSVYSRERTCFGRQRLWVNNSVLTFTGQLFSIFTFNASSPHLAAQHSDLETLQLI